MSKNEGGKMKTTRKTNLKTASNKKQKTSIQFGNKKVFWGLVAFAVVVLGVVGWNVYWDWADESNMKTVEKAIQTLQEREKSVLTKGVFTEKKECEQPVNGWLDMGQLFCTVIESSFLPVSTVEDAKHTIDIHFGTIASSHDIIDTSSLSSNSSAPYPDFSIGLGIADKKPLEDNSIHRGISLLGVSTSGCMVIYSVLNSSSAAEYSPQLGSVSSYYIKATLWCSADTKKRYF